MRAVATIACLSLAGCISLGAEPPTGPLARLPSASEARCADVALLCSASFNGDLEEGEDHDEEQAAVRALLDQMVVETGLVGYVGQEGLDGTRLTLQVRRDTSASLLHGVASTLTLFLIPYWVEVSYDVRGELRGANGALDVAAAHDSWHVLVSPFLVFAMPFDEPAHPVALVERLARAVLSELVARAEARAAARR